MIHRTTFYSVAFLMILQFSFCAAQVKKYTLLAAPYPGAVAELYPAETFTHPFVPLESRMQTFYSKDPLEKVRAHYEKSVGAFEPAYNDATGFYAAVVPSGKVTEYLSGRGLVSGEAGWSVDIRGESAGVTIYGRPLNYNYNVVKVLDALRNAYLQRFIGAETEDAATVTNHLEDPELKKTLAKYDHVQWEYFPVVKEKRMDVLLYDKHYTAVAESLGKEQAGLTKKMTDLSTAGKYDEAGKVGDRMMEITMLSMDAKYNWGVAIKCLEEMALNAYPTKIVIDRPLSEWKIPK